MNKRFVEFCFYIRWLVFYRLHLNTVTNKYSCADDSTELPKNGEMQKLTHLHDLHKCSSMLEEVT